MVHITLDIPSIYTIANFHHTSIVYDRLNTCTIQEAVISQANTMLDIVQANLETGPSGWYKIRVMEKTLIATIFMDIRRVKLSIRVNNYLGALDYVDHALQKYTSWCADYSQYKNLDLQHYPNVSKDVEKIVCDLKEKITLKLESEHLSRCVTEYENTSLSTDQSIDLTRPMPLTTRSVFKKDSRS